MLTAQVIGNLGRNLARFATLEEQLSSGRRINRPSDDPAGTARVLEYRVQQQALDQYQKDVRFGTGWLASTDSALSTINNLLVEAFDMVVHLSDDTYSDDQRTSLAGRASAIIDQVLEAANTQDGNRYIFSGTMTDRATLRASSTGVSYEGDTGRIRTKIGNRSYIDLNAVGDLFTRAFTTLGKDFALEPGITSQTLLSSLHGGAGIQLSPGIIQVVDNNTGAQAFAIVGGATTVGQLLSSMNATLSVSGMSHIRAGISPSDDGLRLDATPTGIVTGVTPLANLNGGRGVDLSPGSFIMRRTDGSGQITIDLAGAATVQDVINRFNATMASNGFGTVSASLRPDGRGLQLRDTAVPPSVFEVVETTTSTTTAADLGLRGILNSVLAGADLNPEPDFEVLDIGAGFTTAADLGIVGRSQRFLDGGSLDPALTLDTPVAALNQGRGLDLGRVRIASGHEEAMVDLGGASTVRDVIRLLSSTGLPVEARLNAAGTGIEIYSTDDTRSLVVTSDTLRTAEDLGIAGSPDLFGSLYVLRMALEQNNGELVRYTNESIQGALNQILYERANAGSNHIRLEATDSRLVDQQLSVTRLRSEYEDADILSLSSELSKQEAVYQAALAAAARMIQPSLAQFLR
jgi:flagellin-like hook-associated protein FlgL